jgi:DNA (cytosine-5)-methyltransferase 1
MEEINSKRQKLCQTQFLGSLYGHGPSFAGAVWDPDGLAPTLTTMQGGGREPHIMEKKLEAKDNLVLEKKIQKVGQNSNEGSQCGTVVSEEGLAPTLSAGCHGYANPHILTAEKEKKIKKLGVLDEKREKSFGAVSCVYSDESISPTLIAGMSHGNTVPHITVRQATKEGTIKCKVGGCYDASFPESKTRRGRVQEDGDVVPTLTASNSESINYVETQYRIRKLTPRECWRLMGYTDADFDSAQEAGVSNSQLYKQAGNAIVKQVLMAIFKQMNIKSIKEMS